MQDSYLNSHSSGSGSSSSVDSATLSVATLDLNEARGVFAQSSLAELGEITRMCDQLNHLERCLAVEKAKEQELELEVGKIRQGRGQEEREGEEANTSLEEARVRSIATSLHNQNTLYNRFCNLFLLVRALVKNIRRELNGSKYRSCLAVVKREFGLKIACCGIKKFDLTEALVSRPAVFSLWEAKIILFYHTSQYRPECIYTRN